MGARGIVIVVALGASMGVGAGVVMHRVMPQSPLVQGLTIGSQRVPRGVTGPAWLIGRRDEARSRRVRLRYDDQVIEATLGDAGVEIDVEATLSRAAKVGHDGPLLRRLREAARARRGKIDVPLVWRVDEDRARAHLARHADAVRRAPVDARLDLARREKIPDTPGRELDVEATIEALRAAEHLDGETVDLATRRVYAAVTLSDLVRVDVGKIVASYETAFVTYGSGAGRAVNIENAARKIDGAVLGPGETFSFNDRVGPRTKESGFTVAPEIQGDETVSGYGGGTCQVSSTLYAAALFGALEAIERQSHSRPSAYTKLGLDATVAFPTVDLKIRNTLPFPVLIHAYLPKPTAIRVEILGGDPTATVEYTYGIGHTEDFTRRIYVKPHLRDGRVRRHQKGSRGYDVTSVVTIRHKDGRTEERRYFSGYRPAPEVYWVPPGYAPEELPPLPEHAAGVEDRTGQREDDAYAM